MLLCCLRRNVEDSCHTLRKFVVVSRHQQLNTPLTSDIVVNLNSES